MMHTKCQQCGSLFQVKPCVIARGHGRYCSKSCANAALRRGKQVRCHVCDKAVWRALRALKRAKTGTYFCGSGCRSAWVGKRTPSGEGHHAWKDGRASYRQRAFKKYGLQCSNARCPLRQAGVTVPVAMLDVDHRDGNHSNHALHNLRVLCVWCHAWKTRMERGSIPRGGT